MGWKVLTEDSSPRKIKGFGFYDLETNEGLTVASNNSDFLGQVCPEAG